ncbi:MAG: hypothetical protein ICV85_03825 [Tolypothrix sp. T3-bin4]|nr:hypothetical protein [Tolypothrix sp. T3-bin4]
MFTQSCHMAIALTPLVTVLRVQFILQMIVLAFIGDGKCIEERAIAIFHKLKLSLIQKA